MTGSVVCAAIAPARWAAAPAPQINSLNPAASAPRAKREAWSGVRWAESTLATCGMP